MRGRRLAYGTIVLLVLVVGIGFARARARPAPTFLAQSPSPKTTPSSTPSLAYQWLDIALEATAREVDRHGARPTILSRTLAIPMTAMFDAWAAYDAKAIGTRLGGALRRPENERTNENKMTAVSYAAYRALLDVYPEEASYLSGELRRFGYDPSITDTESTSPASIGNRAARAIIAYRHTDGANQLGDAPGGTGVPYADYTHYMPVNTARTVVDPNRWQPITFQDGKGGEITPGFLTPYWFKVKPFALESADQFRPPPPPKVGSAQLLAETKENIDLNGNLDCHQKALVEYMRDGPRSTGQSGHWLRFAQVVSRRDEYGLDQDVKLFFAVSNVAMDAFIAAWDSKRAYDSSRPWTLTHVLFKGKEIRGYSGHGDAVTMKGEDWRPYSPPTFVTPPFPGYVSGHSCVSGAAGEIMRLFTGSDVFGHSETRRCGAITEPDPGEEVTIALPTFTATADLAGLSRVLGGYHTQSDNVAGLALGRDVAHFEWPKIKGYFEGAPR